MPDEVFVIVIVAIVAGTFSGLVKQILNYLRERRPTAGSSESSLTTSELQRLMKAAVEEATEPLEARLEAMEAKLDPARALPPADADRDDRVEARPEPAEVERARRTS